MDNSSKYIFLLIGKTGSGKSATGNSILGVKHFVSSDKGVSVTKDISVKTVIRQGCTVTAIDAPGVMDTSVKSDEAKSKSCTEMTSAIGRCPTDGKLAIVLVLKYGERFTEENRLTMYILKNIFGDKDLWRSCIIVLTHGDLFKINNEDDVTFESWLRDQEDELGDLFKDCSYRCVLFNNRTKQPEESDQQFLELVNLTEELDQDYTMTKFYEAKKRQSRLMLEEKLPQVIKDYNTKFKSLLISSSQLSIPDQRCTTFINTIDALIELLNELDSPETIYYNEGEPLLLDEQRREVNSLKQDVETRVNLFKLEQKVSKVRDKPLPGDTDWCHSVIKLDNSTNDLAANIDKNTGLYQYRNRIRLLQSNVKELLLKIQRLKTTESYRNKIQKLTLELNALRSGNDLKQFSPYFVQVAKLRSKLVKINKEIGGLGEILKEIDRFEKDIHIKVNVCSALSGWNRTSMVTGALSVGTVFIPAVGIPLSIALNVAPLIGRIFHTQWLKRNKDKQDN